MRSLILMNEYIFFIRRYFAQQAVCEFIRFAIVGIVATGIHYLVYLLLQQFVPVGVAYTIGYAISFVANFILTARFTFKTKTSVRKGAGFGIAHLCNYLLQMGLLYIMLNMGVNRAIAPIPVYCIAIPLNFLMVRYVFKHKV